MKRLQITTYRKLESSLLQGVLQKLWAIVQHLSRIVDSGIWDLCQEVLWAQARFLTQYLSFHTKRKKAVSKQWYRSKMQAGFSSSQNVKTIWMIDKVKWAVNCSTSRDHLKRLKQICRRSSKWWIRLNQVSPIGKQRLQGAPFTKELCRLRKFKNKTNRKKCKNS